MSSVQSVSRRGFFRKVGTGSSEAVRRPPWVTAQSVSLCTSCGDCTAACPEEIIKSGSDGRPFVDFAVTGCTFCGDCASVCQEAVFDLSRLRAWETVAHISAKCLLGAGVACRICTDFCETEALTFDMRGGPAGTLALDPDKCTACGFCIGACPADAISLSHRIAAPQEPQRAKTPLTEAVSA